MPVPLLCKYLLVGCLGFPSWCATHHGLHESLTVVAEIGQHAHGLELSLASKGPQHSTLAEDVGGQRQSHLPDNLDTMEKDWQRFWIQDQARPTFEASPPTSFKAVFGIFAAFDLPLRAFNAHRQTWMHHRSVCKFKEFKRAHCHVFPAFVVGDLSAAREGVPVYQGKVPEMHASDSDNDLIVLQGEPENENHGKTYAWFRHAVSEFPWATHIAKLDVDTYPFLGDVFSRLQKHLLPNLCRFHYFGNTWGKECLTHAAFTFHQNNEWGNDCQPDARFLFHGGPFYMLSLSLASMLTEGTHWWMEHREGYEDIEVGRAVHLLRRTHKVDCVNMGESLDGSFLHAGGCWPHVEDRADHCNKSLLAEPDELAGSASERKLSRRLMRSG
mmetsp:Transcript_79658/g.141039  ORF Transcript_79658/g.141039 Transcript_79658/m.141039 type:complete len:385 (-) Transcript_79658:13-1167(-)